MFVLVDRESCRAVIRNIPSSTVVKDITIKARNSAGLVGQVAKAEIDGVMEFSTKAASRHRQLQQQLKMAIDLEEKEPGRKHIDTVFLQVSLLVQLSRPFHCKSVGLSAENRNRRIHSDCSC